MSSRRSFFFDALAQCGTNACVNVLANLITSKKMPTEQIDNALTALNFIQDPTPGMINAVIVSVCIFPFRFATPYFHLNI